MKNEQLKNDKIVENEIKMQYLTQQEKRKNDLIKKKLKEDNEKKLK